MEQSTVHFTIHGDFITEHFRSLVREGDWRKAQQGLIDSLVDLPIDIAYSVLSGKYKFVGVNELDLEEDDKHSDNEWILDQYYPYTQDLIIVNGNFYKQYKTVSYLNKNDMDQAMENLGITSLPINSELQQVLHNERIKTYLNNPSDDIYLHINDSWHCFEKIEPDFPAWLTKEQFKEILNINSNKDYSEEWNMQQIEVDAIDDYELIQQNEQQAETNKKISSEFVDNLFKIQNFDEESTKEKIKQQANENGGFLTLKNKQTGNSFEIPRNPFLRWCLNDNPLYDTIEWSSVSPRGLKQGGDDPNHTDWFLFTGIPLEDGQNYENPDVKFLFDMRYQYFSEYTSSNLKPLSKGSHSGFHKADVIHIQNPNDTTLIKKDSIIVLPNCSPKFEMVVHLAAKSNCIVISETGGKLCHLATVSRENNLSLYLLPDALNVLKNGSVVSLSTKEDNISIKDYSGDELQRIMLSKISGEHYK